MGIVYLIQPEEYLGTNNYKIGRSGNETIKRITNYGKNTRILSILKVNNTKYIEKIIINKFKSIFQICKGREYFIITVEETDLIKEFNNLVIKNNFIKCPGLVLIDKEKKNVNILNETFKTGKYLGRTFEDVKKNTNYFYYLIAQPVGNVINYLDFIYYCK